MNATVNVLCYKSKALSNGENPLMIRVSKNGKRTYKSLGISINPTYWDFEKSKPKRNCPDKEQIEKLIIEKLKAFNQTILELNATQKDYTSHSLINRVEKPLKIKTLIRYSVPTNSNQKKNRLRLKSSIPKLVN